MRNITLPVAVAVTVTGTFAALLAGCGGDSQPVRAPKFSLAVIGDVPYGTAPADTSQFIANPAFISSINADPDNSVVLHVGDIHSGKQFCTLEYDLSIQDQWKAFKLPLVYTPGDNEWADCHKAKEGGGTFNPATGKIAYNLDASGNFVDYAAGDPLANLQLLRSLFFATPGKAGAMSVHSQALEFDPAHPTDREFVENVWWENGKVVFVTVNLPGGSNNDMDPWYGAPTMSPPQAQEVSNRSAADLRWLETAFKQANALGSVGIVIQIQADMWDLDGAAPSHIAAYKPFIDLIAAQAKAFGKPVLLLNGDSHVYRSDNPLVPGAPCVIEPSSGAIATPCVDDAYANQPNGYNVPNFHRVVVHGSTFPLEWLKLTVDPEANAPNGSNAFGPFGWKRMQPKL